MPGLLLDMPHLAESGADGVGLFRTELQFMIGETMPRLADQVAFYQQVIDAAGDKPVVFRTLDLGGDKVLPYARWEREENPALGWRAIRIALDRPALLRYQVRALMQAAAGRTLNILLPLVSDVAEFNRRARADRPRNRTRPLSGLAQPRQTRVGAMLEVPALAFMLPQIMRSADFVSIGSNDLFQFVFAVDRTNPRVSRRYDPLNPATLTLIRLIVQSASEVRGRSVAVRRNGGQAARCHGAARARTADALDAARQYRAGENDDPQPRSARSFAVRGPLVRPDGRKPPNPPVGVRGRTRDRSRPDLNEPCGSKGCLGRGNCDNSQRSNFGALRLRNMLRYWIQ